MHTPLKPFACITGRYTNALDVHNIHEGNTEPTAPYAGLYCDRFTWMIGNPRVVGSSPITGRSYQAMIFSILNSRKSCRADDSLRERTPAL